MKKVLKLFALAFAVLLAVFACACANENISDKPKPEPKSATEFTEQVNLAMDALDSYEYEARVEVTFIADGTETLIANDAVGIAFGMTGEDPYLYSSNKASMKTGSITFHDISGSTKTYYGGRLFIHSTESGKDTQKLYSIMSFEDYDAYQDEYGFSLRSKVVENFTDGELTHREDGTWECVYSGYEGNLQMLLADICSATEEDVGRKISGIGLTIITDESFRVKSMDFKLTSDTEDSKGSNNVVTVKYEYGKYNSAERLLDHLKQEEYTEIEDVRVLAQLDKLVEDRRKEESGSVYVFMEQDIKINGNSSKSDQVYEIRYGLKDGTYAYSMDMTAGGVTATLEYHNGKQTLKQMGEEESYEMTDLQAKMVITESIFGTLGFSSVYASELEYADGVYTVKCNDVTSSDIVESFYLGGDSNVNSAVQGFILTVKDGKLMTVESELTMNVTVIDSGQSYNYVIKMNTETIFDYGTNAN